MLSGLYDKIKFSGMWLDMNEPSNFRREESVLEDYSVQHRDSINIMTMNVNVQHYNSLDPTQPLNHSQVHAYYGHLQVMATYRFFQSINQRPFIITRSNSVGTGRFAGHWTGDNAATWPFLRLSIGSNFLNQIFGIQMVGSDICGFHLSTTNQLCSRWHQLGSLYPFARNHNEIDSQDQEPWVFGNETLRTAKLSIDFRYSILKQYYSIFVKNKGLGTIFRPLFFEFPNDEHAYIDQVEEKQFLIGDLLMSTPILEFGTNLTHSYFPGTWFNLESGSVYSNWMNVTNTLPSAPPVFLRSGRMLFLNNATTRTHTLNSDFKLKVGFERVGALYVSKGFILSINNYNKETDLNLCIAQDCLYEFKAKMKHEDSAIELSWNFIGPKRLAHRLRVLSVNAFFPDRQPIQYSPIRIDISGTGRFNLGS